MRRRACSRALALWLTGASASEHVGGLGTVLLPASIHVLDRGGKVRFFINTSAACEFNDGLLGLANDISVSIAHQHHRKLGFKSKEGGPARAKAGVMRRLSMTALRSTARQVLRGLAIVGPTCIHQRNAREAAHRAHLDAFGADRGAPWRDPTNGG